MYILLTSYISGCSYAFIFVTMIKFSHLLGKIYLCYYGFLYFSLKYRFFFLQKILSIASSESNIPTLVRWPRYPGIAFSYFSMDLYKGVDGEGGQGHLGRDQKDNYSRWSSIISFNKRLSNNESIRRRKSFFFQWTRTKKVKQYIPSSKTVFSTIHSIWISFLPRKPEGF